LVIITLIAAYCGIGYFLHLKYSSEIVFSHVAYIPIGLAGIWWGKRCIIVAGACGAVLFLFHVVGISTATLLSDLARTAFFILAGFTIGVLSDRIHSSRAALWASEVRHRSLIEKSLAGIFVYHKEKVIYCNNKLLDMLEYTTNEIIGLTLWSLFDDRDLPHIRDVVLQRKEKKLADAHYECRLQKKNGKPIWVDLSSSPINFEGREAIIVNVYDITNRKKAENKEKELTVLARQQEEQLVHSTRLAELGEMAAGIAHELNQPLTGIRNFARNTYYMLKNRAGSPEEIEGNLRLISEQVDRASKIIGQMREFTRQTEPHFTNVDVNAIIRESVDFLTPQLKLDSINTALDLNPDIPKVAGDRIRLEQVFLNLITNARQAMAEEEQRELTITSCREEQDNRAWVTVSIKDTGKGFEPQDKEKLFRPFYSTKKAGQGTGLGLSISLSIINDHNGIITAQNSPGQGATFFIRLPVPMPDVKGEDNE
jgi:PAS domain S-box-containing protein